jgi:CSLREA domain-containing protein
MHRNPVRLIARSLLAASLLVGALPAAAATITVNTFADELNADGDCSLREAVQAANTNAAVDACTAGTAGPDTIVLPIGTIPVGAAIQVNETVTIRGAGGSSSTIDAAGSTAFNSSAASVDIALEDLALSGGMNASGGALAATRVDFFPPAGTINTLSGAIALTDVALGSGARVNSSSGAVTLLRVTFDSNNTINTLSGAISLTDSAVIGGGRINSSSGSVTLTRSTIRVANGTAINTSTGAIALTQSDISGGSGTGVNTSSGAVTLVDSSVSNVASYGIYGGSGTVTLTRSLVARSGDEGIAINSGRAVLVNSTLSGNAGRAIDGTGTVSLDAVTITGNVRGALPAALGATTTAIHTIFGPNGGANCGAPLGSAQFSIDTGTSCGLAGAGNLPNTNPLLLPLANNGGPTQTHLPQQPGSPAIDAGSNGICQAADQRGTARPVDGDGNGTATCDIGAVEAGAGTAPPQPPQPPADIPTLSQWALALLGLLVALLAFGQVKRSRRS